MQWTPSILSIPVNQHFVSIHPRLRAHYVPATLTLTSFANSSSNSCRLLGARGVGIMRISIAKDVVRSKDRWGDNEISSGSMADTGHKWNYVMGRAKVG